MIFKKQKELIIDNGEKEFLLKNIPSELLDPVKLNPYIYGKKTPKFSLNYIRYIWKTQIRKNRVILIRMMLRNGKTSEFLVTPIAPIFQYLGGAYIIDTDYLREDISSGYYFLNYHQDISLPLLFKIDIDTIKKKLRNNAEQGDIIENIDPMNLRGTVNSTVIQKVLSGGEMESLFMFIKISIIILLILCFLTLIVVGYGFIGR